MLWDPVPNAVASLAYLQKDRPSWLPRVIDVEFVGSYSSRLFSSSPTLLPRNACYFPQRRPCDPDDSINNVIGNTLQSPLTYSSVWPPAKSWNKPEMNAEGADHQGLSTNAKPRTTNLTFFILFAVLHVHGPASSVALRTRTHEATCDSSPCDAAGLCELTAAETSVMEQYINRCVCALLFCIYPTSPLIIHHHHSISGTDLKNHTRLKVRVSQDAVHVPIPLVPSIIPHGWLQRRYNVGSPLPIFTLKPISSSAVSSPFPLSSTTRPVKPNSISPFPSSTIALPYRPALPLSFSPQLHSTKPGPLRTLH